MNNNNISYRIPRLIVKFLENKISEKELEELNRWRYASESNMVLFHELTRNPERIYLQRATVRNSFQKKQNWKGISRKIKAEKRKNAEKLFLKAAAILILFIAPSIFLFYQINKKVQKTTPPAITPGITQAVLVTGSGKQYDLKENIEIEEQGVRISTKKDKIVYKTELKKNTAETTYNTIIIPKGGEYQLKLIDGTQVWLNSDSKLRYPTAFNEKERKVYLQGEALFKVTEDKKHPFIVDVHNVAIKVLGTTFNVNAYADQNNITTTLVEGKVRVESDFFEKTANLLPSNQYIFNAATGKSKMTTVNTDIYTAWARGRFVFENESLHDIMIRLERWYDIKVFFSNSKSADLRFSGDIARYENIDEVLNLLSKTKKVKFQLKDRNLIVK